MPVEAKRSDAAAAAGCTAAAGKRHPGAGEEVDGSGPEITSADFSGWNGHVRFATAKSAVHGQHDDAVISVKDADSSDSEHETVEMDSFNRLRSVDSDGDADETFKHVFDPF